MSYLLIIGAKSDVAKAIAVKYATEGYDLYLAARKSEELKTFASDIYIRTQRDVQCLDLDVLDYVSHEGFYEGLKEKPEGVILTVGYLGEQKKAQNDFAESEKIMDTNYKGSVSILNIIANDFEQRKKGFIVAISSVAGDRGRRSNYIYGSAKAALTAYLSGLRSRLSKAGIHVLTVKPGFMNTKMIRGLNPPKLLTTQPQQVAKDIFNFQRKSRDILYTKRLWRYIMWMVKHLPEKIFKRLNF